MKFCPGCISSVVFQNINNRKVCLLACWIHYFGRLDHSVWGIAWLSFNVYSACSYTLFTYLLCCVAFFFFPSELGTAFYSTAAGKILDLGRLLIQTKMNWLPFWLGQEEEIGRDYLFLRLNVECCYFCLQCFIVVNQLCPTDVNDMHPFCIYYRFDLRSCAHLSLSSIVLKRDGPLRTCVSLDGWYQGHASATSTARCIGLSEEDTHALYFTEATDTIASMPPWSLPWCPWNAPVEIYNSS